MDQPYEPRYLAGIVLFNRGDFFEAHEVWESLWMETFGPEKKFYQALIQAAVAAYHWSRGNAAGAKRLYHSGRKYMEPFRPVHMGLAVDDFWNAMASHLAPAIGDPTARPAAPPAITLLQSRRS